MPGPPGGHACREECITIETAEESRQYHVGPRTCCPVAAGAAGPLICPHDGSDGSIRNRIQCRKTQLATGGGDRGDDCRALRREPRLLWASGCILEGRKNKSNPV